MFTSYYCSLSLLGLVPREQLHTVCMWDGLNPSNHTEVYLRVKNELGVIWKPYQRLHFPEDAPKE
jgi:hypothetical protein